MDTFKCHTCCRLTLYFKVCNKTLKNNAYMPEKND